MDMIKLSNGVQMPLEGFGVFQVPDPAVCKQAVLDAVCSGYPPSKIRPKPQGQTRARSKVSTSSQPELGLAFAIRRFDPYIGSGEMISFGAGAIKSPFTLPHRAAV